jgi:glucokinase
MRLKPRTILGGALPQLGSVKKAMSNQQLPWQDNDKLALGVDLGGTKIAAILATPQGEVVARRRQPTPAQEGPEAVIRSLKQTIYELKDAPGIASSQIIGIGISAAGIIDSKAGVVTTSPNLPGWQDIPLREIIQREFGWTTFLENDANSAALGEYYFGAARGIDNFIYITISTGIGSGIFINGQLYRGVSGAAGEAGHMSIKVDGPQCNCGNIGCWETLASGSALAREAVKQIEQGARTAIWELAQGDLTQVTAEIVFQAAQQGDQLAQALISRLSYYLGMGLVNLVNIFNPELILIGGGVAEMGERLLQPAINLVKERAFSLSAEAVRIEKAQLGNDSGVLGATTLVWLNIINRRTP